MSLAIAGIGSVQSYSPPAVAPIEPVAPVPAIAPVGDANASDTAQNEAWQQGATFERSPSDEAQHLTYEAHAAPKPAEPPVNVAGDAGVVTATRQLSPNTLDVADVSPDLSAIPLPSAPTTSAQVSTVATSMVMPDAQAGGVDNGARAESIASAVYAMVAQLSSGGGVGGDHGKYA